MIECPYIIHALSPLHAGVGQSAGVIDLPIARMTATGIPFLPGSSIKGVLRDRREGTTDAGPFLAAFGAPTTDPDAHAGAVVFGDARLLALPVRSFRGAFAWVTSPLLLELASRDTGWTTNIPRPAERSALIAKDSVCKHRIGEETYLYLEDLDLPVREDPSATEWAGMLAKYCGDDAFRRRFSIVDDDTMAFLWETATQVDQRIRIDGRTGTVADGALWLEESLPPETILIGVMAADRGRRTSVDRDKQREDAMLNIVLKDGTHEVVQFGGKATIGRGRCRVWRLPLTKSGR